MDGFSDTAFGIFLANVRVVWGNILYILKNSGAEWTNKPLLDAK